MADYPASPGEVTRGSLVRTVCAGMNALLAVLVLVFAVVDQVAGPPGRQKELAFPLAVIMLFAAVAAGLMLRKRWLVVIPAIPLFLAAILLAFLVAAGGWIWGPENAATMNGLIAGGIAIAGLQAVGIVIAARLRRTHTPDTNS